MNESSVFTPAHCSAASAKPRATTSCAPNLARLLRPSERFLVTFMKSSARPMNPVATVRMMTRNPARVNGAFVPAWPIR